MKTWKLSPLIVALLSGQSFAVDPIGWELGSGIIFLPSASTSVESNDNIYSQNADKTSDVITRVAPTFAVAADMGRLYMNASYALEAGFYSDENDNYLDQMVAFDSEYEIDNRQTLLVDVSYNSAHDARGACTAEGSAANAFNDPDEYSDAAIGIKYNVGSKTAPFNMNFSFNNNQKRYSNNEAITEKREFDKVQLGALLAYTVSSATNVLREYRRSDVTYISDDQDAQDREGQENKLLAGASWDITGATTGEVKMGIASRSFNETSIDASTGLSWEASLIWDPISYSTITFSSSQNNNEATGEGNLIDSANSSVNWKKLKNE
jgi:hypothetical protein